MKLIAPDYYARFACIAGACRHSCCIGWEIGIDPDTLDFYQQLDGDIGARLKQHIDLSPEGACFRLQGAEERCPFLNADGLCDLILTLGEDALCQICRDHPRFRNFYSDRTEIGLGLCCEEAGRLILGQASPVMLQVLEDDGTAEEQDAGEQQLLVFRDQLISLMQDRTQPLEKRAEMLAAAAGARAEDVAWEKWTPFLLSLERLDDHWGTVLSALADAPCRLPVIPPPLQTPMEQWMVYLLYRHLPGALDDGLQRERLLLCVLMWLAAAQLCALQSISSLEELVQLCRLFSSEWEYSEENIASLLDELARRLPET